MPRDEELSKLVELRNRRELTLEDLIATIDRLKTEHKNLLIFHMQQCPAFAEMRVQELRLDRARTKLDLLTEHPTLTPEEIDWEMREQEDDSRIVMAITPRPQVETTEAIDPSIAADYLKRVSRMRVEIVVNCHPDKLAQQVGYAYVGREAREQIAEYGRRAGETRIQELGHHPGDVRFSIRDLTLLIPLYEEARTYFGDQGLSWREVSGAARGDSSIPQLREDIRILDRMIDEAEGELARTCADDRTADLRVAVANPEAIEKRSGEYEQRAKTLSEEATRLENELASRQTA